MSGWLKSLIHRRGGERGSGPSRVLELLVLEGLDAGEVFTVDGDEVTIGRRLEDGERGRGVMLKDATVSSRQALIRRRNGVLTLQHLNGATNPTLVDGRPARGEVLRDGSRIQIGRVAIQVRERQGMAISHLTQLFSEGGREQAAASDRRRGGTDAPTEQIVIPSNGADSDTTAIRPLKLSLGQLVVEQGVDATPGRKYPIWSDSTLLGRSPEAHVRVTDIGVSRRHAELVPEDGELLLVHRSRVNPTLLNGSEVVDRARVLDGDLIQLADSVVLRVELDARSPRRVRETAAERERRSLRQHMEQRIEIDRHIEERFSVQGSFLDVDVVNSYGMKAEATRADHIVVSFERFRAYVGGIVTEFGGHVLNSNGDELMCYFESPLNAVRAGFQVLERLADFNESRNLLQMRFRFRLGIHTGRSLVDLDQGVAYSPVLDVAGHLQKLADPDCLLVSQQTMDALPPGLPFEEAGEMDRESLVYYRLIGPVD